MAAACCAAWARLQFLIADPTRAEAGPLFGTPGCAPLVWERVHPHSRYSYAVTPLDQLIRREFVVSDLSNVFAPRSIRQRAQEARVRRATRRNRCEGDGNFDSDSSTEPGDAYDDPSSSEEDGMDSDSDVAHEVAEDGADKRWPRWIRSGFIWGWEK